MTDCYLTPIDEDPGCSRRHAIRVFAAAAGGAVLGGPLLRRASGTPWEHQCLSTQLKPDGSPLGVDNRYAYEKQIRQTAPTLALEPDGTRVWTSWTTARSGSESIWLRPFSDSDSAWGDALCVSETKEPGGPVANQSEIAFVGGRVLVVWTEYTGNGWRLEARSIDPASGQLSSVVTLAGSSERSEFISNPALAVVGDHALVAWQAKFAAGRNFAVLARLLHSDGQPKGDAFAVSTDPGRDCCRLAVAAAPNGQGFAIAYDQQDGPGTQNVYVVTYDTPGTSSPYPLAVTSHPASDLCPALAYAPDGEMLWVAWHSNRRGAAGWDIPHWYRLAALRLGDRTWHKPVAARGGPPPTPEGEVQGFELVRLAVADGGLVCVLGRASHNFYVQYYTGDERSPIYRLPKDGWGGRGRLLRGQFDRRGSLWTVRRDIGTNVLQRIDGFDIA
ncbi:MAG: hypothetical protein GY778_21150, partial [bacterium]|nr:hypothetical protein [bacterium]